MDDVDPPAQSQFRSIEYVLRGLSKVCIDNDMPVEISSKSVQCWVKRQYDNGQNETSTGMLLRQIAKFPVLTGEKKKLRNKLKKEAARYARRGRLKRKHEWLLQNPTDVAMVWYLAEDIRIRCSTHRESGSCGNNGKFRLDKIEATIFSSLTEHLMHPTYLNILKSISKPTMQNDVNFRRHPSQIARS
ncbi:hypothetical protein SAMN04487859_11410 [Roseovarius lutimaris]|uniref:Uncharacterized protein n=1 Tax=Roseovarius lutimaris TaxID=1005928 RepID=A0A1I5DZ12_9RHOB|nr:hypothetical protein [Roseovarius lutimaris]SFO04413.1 hypothetical protein SAMN04487859_11410 [Roseovarius lutimaris]